MKTRVFEQYEQVRRFTENGKMIRVKVVIQDTKKVIQTITGLESLIFAWLWNNMKKNQFALVFNEETEEMYGYISKDENGIPRRYKETENLTFKDMYEVVK